MDFFEYATFSSLFVNDLWVQLLVGGLCFAVVFIFQAVALFTIAGHEGYSHRWMAFIPFFNTYYIGVCAQKNKFYNIDAKKLGLTVAILEFVLVAGYVLFYVASYLVLDYIVMTETNRWGMTDIVYDINGNLPASLDWAAWIFKYFGKILGVAELIYLLFEICLLCCFFQTYACRRYWLFTFTCILFPIQGILFFAVRNNRGVNYKDFIRREQEKRYRMYQQQNFYQNPYNQSPYNQNPYSHESYGRTHYGDSKNQENRSGSVPPPEDPFGDLGGSGSTNSGNSPFDEYR